MKQGLVFAPLGPRGGERGPLLPLELGEKVGGTANPPFEK